MAGHPTVGASFVLAREGLIPRSGDKSEIRLQEAVISRRSARRSQASSRNRPPSTDTCSVTTHSVGNTVAHAGIRLPLKQFTQCTTLVMARTPLVAYEASFEVSRRVSTAMERQGRVQTTFS